MYNLYRLKINPEVKKDSALNKESSGDTAKTSEQIQKICGNVCIEDNVWLNNPDYYVQHPTKGKFVFQTNPINLRVGGLTTVNADLSFSGCSSEQKEKYEKKGYSGIIY